MLETLKPKDTIEFNNKNYQVVTCNSLGETEDSEWLAVRARLRMDQIFLFQHKEDVYLTYKPEEYTPGDRKFVIQNGGMYLFTKPEQDTAAVMLQYAEIVTMPNGVTYKKKEAFENIRRKDMNVWNSVLHYYDGKNNGWSDLFIVEIGKSSPSGSGMIHIYLGFNLPNSKAS